MRFTQSGTVSTVSCRTAGAMAVWALSAGLACAEVRPPDYYPADYADLISAAEAEDGELVIYSSYEQKVWQPVFDAFQETYPFVKRVKNLDLEGEEVYQKLKMEHSVGNPIVDVVEIQPSVGAKLQNEQDLLLPYESPELSQYPHELVVPYDNGFQYAISALVIGYNAKVLPRPVNSLADVAAILAEHEGEYTVGVRNISSGFAFGMYHALLSARPELWEEFEAILPNAKPEGSSGSLLTKLQTGEYAAAIFVSDAIMVPAAEKGAGLLGVTLAEDGTPFQGAAVSISAKAPHPATAKLFVDFMLSAEGQQAILEGGRPAIRQGLPPVEGLSSFAEASARIPADSVVVAPYAEISAEEVKTFSERWNGLLNQ